MVGFGLTAPPPTTGRKNFKSLPLQRPDPIGSQIY